jgi:hypothetical protein
MNIFPIHTIIRGVSIMSKQVELNRRVVTQQEQVEPSEVFVSEEIELGWMDIIPCTRIKWKIERVGGGIKIKIPVLETAPQRLYGYVTFEASRMEDAAKAAAVECALGAIAVAGGFSAIIGNPIGAGPAFASAFVSCMAEKVPDIAISGVNLHTAARCMW